MQFDFPLQQRNPIRRLTIIALLAAVGIALFVIESYIPMPFPFLKIGLANISSVLALFLLGGQAMVTVVLIRVIAGSFLVGTFMGPAFILAISAGLCSAVVMMSIFTAARNVFSPLGISLLGSITHVIVQLLVVRYVYVESATVLHLLPLLLTTALVGGIIVGWISLKILRTLRQVRV